MQRITIDPVTRIEGHLKFEAIVDDSSIKEAHCSGLLFRGFEILLKGRDPRDAQRITQRICGVCPTAHAMASTLALDSAFGIADRIPNNGRIMRNLILGSNFIQSHILHFYHLAALDYVDVTAAANYTGTDRYLRQVSNFIARGELSPFLPRYEGDYRLPKEVSQQAVTHYVEALNKRREAQEMLAIFGGKMPHSTSIFPGGTLEKVTVSKIAAFRWRLTRIQDFIDTMYIPDVLAVAQFYPDYFEIGQGCKRFLSYGAWDMDSEADLLKRKRMIPNGTANGRDMKRTELDVSQITEQVKNSWYKSASNLPPSHGETEPDSHKPDAYSFIKSPRYSGDVYEVGPLARMLVSYLDNNPRVVELINSTLSTLNAQPAQLFSVLGRHAARALETKLVADAMADWILELKPNEPCCTPFDIPTEASGFGITEAPRGSLGHWITIKDGVIDRYQAIVPTTWNCSPRDDNNQSGACEQALEGTRIRDIDNPFEVVRIIRSFDPCLACSIHFVTPKGQDIRSFQVT